MCLASLSLKEFVQMQLIPISIDFFPMLENHFLGSPRFSLGIEILISPMGKIKTETFHVNSLDIGCIGRHITSS